MKFKIGDWVKNKGFKNDGNEELLIKKLKVQQQIDFVCKYEEEWELWEPQPREWCVIPNGYNSFTVSRFVSEEYHDDVKVTLALFESGDTYDMVYVEPFIGTLPSFIKEQ